MANNYLLFSFMVTDVTPEGFAYFEELVKKYEEREDMLPCQYEFEEDKQIWFYTEEYGDPGGLAEILSDYLKAYDPPGRIAFTWAITCSKMRLDEFGGGGVVITADELRFMDAQLWTERTV